MKKQLLKYKSAIFSLLILELIIALTIYMSTQREIDTFIDNKIQSAEIEYQAIYTKTKEQAEMIFQENINIPIVINNFKNAYTADKKEQKIIRKKLYDDLLPSYLRLEKLIHLRQLHFHLPNNTSFLRMHQADKFGDDLSDIRATVEYVNKYKKPIDGFEEGRIYNGFRFVYPLFDNSKIYLGSVEASFSIEAFKHVLNNNLHLSKFLILKSIVDKKVWKDDSKANYEESPISPLFLMDKTQVDNKIIEIFSKKIPPKLKVAFAKNILHENSFSLQLHVKGTTHLFIFLPIKNPVSMRVASYIVLISQDNLISDINEEFWMLQIFSFIFIAVIFTLIYRNQENHELLIKSELKYSNIINNIKEYYFFYSHGKDGIFTYLSDSITDILGYTKEEFMLHYSTYLAGDSMQNAKKATNKIIKGEPQEPYVISIYHKNGSLKHFEISESRLNDSHGNFISIDGVARDITQNYLTNQELKDKHIELQKSYDLLNKLSVNIPGAIYQYRLYPDGKASFPYVSNGIEDIYEVFPEDVVDDAQAVFDILHPDDLDMVVQSIQNSATSMQDWTLEYRVKLPKKGVRWLIGHAKPEKLEDGSILWHGFIDDITERKKIEAELKEQHKYLQSIIDGVDDPIMVIKEDYTIELMNNSLKDSIKDIYIADPEHPKCYEISHHRSTPCDGFEHPCPLRDVLESKKHTTVIHNHNTKDGDNRYIELSASPLFDKENNCIGIIESARDITEHLTVQSELREQKNILNYQAHHDALTKLPNRILFSDRLEQAIEKGKRNHSKFALLFIDLDHFKEINDSLGHAVGDEILKIVTARLRETIREEDSVARLGGDEFTVILEDLDQAQDASYITTKILKILAKAIHIEDNVLYVSSSIGISVYPDDGDSSQNLLKFADSAMYKAKDEGRNNFQYYSTDMTKLALERVVMETNLRDGLKNEEFVVYYQPQVNGVTNTLVGMEALVRWKHPRMGLVLPSKFIPLAEKIGLIVKLDRLVMKMAMTQVVQWHKKGLKPGVLAMNLSVKQLREKDFIQTLKNLMKETNCKPEWIELEVTEGHIMTNPEESIKVLSQITNLGIELAVDDFGTGYSSLAYLKKLPINKLKIDRVFVMDLPDDEEDVGISKAVIALAKSLNLKVIAEGVETKAQRDFLVENKCENIQGYFYSKPIPANKMEVILLNGFDS